MAPREWLTQQQDIDLTYAPEILRDCSASDIESNPILRFLNGDKLESILADSSPEGVTKAYRDLVKKHHPDYNPSQNAQDAIRINKIFILVGDIHLKLSSKGKEELPIAIDIMAEYREDKEEEQDFWWGEDERTIAINRTFSVDLWKPNGTRTYSVEYAHRDPDAKMNLNPNLSDREMIIAYGTKTSVAHEWEGLGWITYVAFRSIDKVIEIRPDHWCPVNRSLKDAFNTSTAIMCGREGGIFLCPTALAPEYQESIPGRLDSIHAIYTGTPTDEILPARLPTHIVAVDDPSYDLVTHPIFREETIQAWAYLDNATLIRLRNQFHQRFLEQEQLRGRLPKK